MRFDKDAIKFVGPVAVLSAIFFAVGLHLAGSAAAIIAALVLLFFRDPKRNTGCAPDRVIAPADGKVVEIAEVEEDEYLGSKARRISIFLSIFNVHINYIPIAGTVEFIKYRQGRYHCAASGRASKENAQNIMGIRNNTTKIFLKQIAGVIARRVVCRLHASEEVLCGQKFGLMRFGSRIEIYLPPECEIKVKKGQNVVGAVTELATYGTKTE